MPIENLALALGSSLSAGLNLYLTVLTLGLMDHLEMIHLPEGLDGLSHPGVLAVAALLLLVELVADKIPYLDNSWDAVHSFIRIPAGALLALGAMGGVIEGPIWWAAALVGGSVSLAAHGAKSSARLALNTTPEPFTNWFVSLFEDAFSLFVLWLVSANPYLALGLVLVALVSCLLLIWLLLRFFVMVFRRGPAAETQNKGAKPSYR